MEQTNSIIKTSKYQHTTYAQRVAIQTLLNEGCKVSYIAKKIGRSRTTIYKEIKQGTVTQIMQGKKKQVYLADTSQEVYRKNRINSKKKYKILEVSEFINYVQDKFKEDKWSYDAAVGYARKHRLFKKTVCSKTLYNYTQLGLLDIKNIDLPLKVKRKQRKNRDKHKIILGESIDKRAKYIENRKQFGHFEIDTVIGNKSKKDKVLLTLIERKTRYYMSVPIKQKSADEVNKALRKILSRLGDKASKVIKSITSDNGLEFSRLNEFEDITKIYYAHPYSSFERGSNERHNGLLRRFIPKHTSINKYDITYIRSANQILNALPRKILGYSSPEECFDKEMDAIYKA